ncbi:hypothetical protein XaC1_76 [Xanthomonas phage XaC1]|nr:hypothetical protein XaC1_76 [Xanthomonas phage XaC1]
MEHDEYVDVMVKLIKKAASLTNGIFSYVLGEKEELVFRKSTSYVTCEFFTNDVWENLFFITTPTDSTCDFMRSYPKIYSENVQYKSDTEEYWTIDGKCVCYTSDEVKDSSFYFNLSLVTQSIRLLNHIKILQCFRETEEAQNLLNTDGYHVMIYKFSDTITQNLVKILEEGKIKK